MFPDVVLVVLLHLVPSALVSYKSHRIDVCETKVSQNVACVARGFGSALCVIHMS